MICKKKAHGKITDTDDNDFRYGNNKADDFTCSYPVKSEQPIIGYPPSSRDIFQSEFFDMMDICVEVGCKTRKSAVIVIGYMNHVKV